MKKFTFMILVLVLIAPVHWAFAAVPTKGGNLVVCQPAEPPGLDPTANTAAAIDRVVYANIYEGLVKVNDAVIREPGNTTTASAPL